MAYLLSFNRIDSFWLVIFSIIIRRLVSSSSIKLLLKFIIFQFSNVLGCKIGNIHNLFPLLSFERLEIINQLFPFGGHILNFLIINIYNIILGALILLCNNFIQRRGNKMRKRILAIFSLQTLKKLRIHLFKLLKIILISIIFWLTFKSWEMDILTQIILT